jgi:23S rRNA pseudouridine1911/1915/1917 synthase
MSPPSAGRFKVGEYTVNYGPVMSAEKQIITIPEEFASLRLDQALARMFPEYSRSRLKEWLLAGAITVEGGPKRPRDAVSGGETVTFRPQVEISVRAEAEPIALEIAYEDDDLLVVNKAAGLVVHPGAGNPAGTLLNGLLHHVAKLAEIPRAGIIHRLDKDTSGLLLVAKSLTVHTALVRLLAEREISRHYLAVCNGVLTGGGTIREPISRHPVDRKRMSVQQNGKPAVTHFTVKERFAAFTYVNVKLETGRTHQIRVHFAHRRHALVGDQTYGGRLALPKGASDELIQLLRHFKRQALHATRLAFEHPVSGEMVDLETAPPKDFQMLIETMRGDMGDG